MNNMKITGNIKNIYATPPNVTNQLYNCYAVFNDIEAV